MKNEGRQEDSEAGVRRTESGGRGNEQEEEKIRGKNTELFANLYACVKRRARDDSLKKKMVKERSRDLVVVREQEAVITKDFKKGEERSQRSRM